VTLGTGERPAAATPYLGRVRAVPAVLPGRPEARTYPPERALDAGTRERHGRTRPPNNIGLLLTVLVTAASVQDRDAARPLLWNLRRAFPAVKLAWADGGYAEKLVTWAKPS
jgi:hypothetical protein